jgi:GTP-binding protein EngB required for normal cell division
MTGAGKSTFISHLTDTKVVVGHDLTSCTSEVDVFPTKVGNQAVLLIDTPGFADTHRSDTDVLHQIAQYLSVAYTNETKLTGLIYIHPISDPRMTGPALKNLRMFRQLVGDDNLANVVFVTSKWDLVEPEVGHKREQGLKDEFWGTYIAAGAAVKAHDGTPESARDIVASLCKGSTPFYSQLQIEVCEKKLSLADTAAGRSVMKEINDVKRRYEEEIRQANEMLLAEQAKAQANEKLIQAFKEEMEKSQAHFSKTLQEEREMRNATTQTMQNRISELEKKCVVL